MTQHEYVFVAISIILGLAITRLLNTVAMLIRAHRIVEFHWASALWGLCVMAYTLQFWWVGWGLRDFEHWSFLNFVVLTVGSICVYGAAELALPVPGGTGKIDFLLHSKGLGRLSALSLLLYFGVGPYVNISMFNNEFGASLILPGLGIALMALIIGLPRYFPFFTVGFSVYTSVILYITA